METIKRLLLLAIVMHFFYLSQAQTVQRGPYLQMATTSSIYIHWKTNSPTNTKVWYGDAPNNLASTLTVPGSRTNHEIHITGLSANTIYYYAVGNNGGQLEGGDDDHFFKTSPGSNSNATVKAWVLGNAGNDEDDQNDVRDGFYNFIGDENIDLMILLGDNAYEDGTDSEYQDYWFDGIYQEHIINSVMYSTFGNHDGGASESDEEEGPYYDIFNFPKNGQAGGQASGTEAYYSFDYGNIHFISINSYDIDRDVGEPMYDWVLDDVNNTNQDWIVAFFHYPPYTGNDNNSSDTHPKETDMRENFVPILEDAGVDLVLSAHHHSYQRSYLINGHHDVSATWDANTMGLDMGDGRENGNGAYFKDVGEVGTVYIVSGSAGGVGSNPAGYPAMYTSAQTLGSVYLEVTGLEMDVKFIDDNGNVDDYFTIQKDTPPTVNITSPSNNEYFPSPQEITISASANDNGYIDHVEFFVDNVLVGSDDSAPYSINWPIPGEGFYEIEAVATDNLNSTASSTIQIEVGDGSVCVSIQDGNSDVEEKTNGDMSMGSSDLELAEDEPHFQSIGLRFTGLNIPQGAVINSAYIQFTCDKNENINPCILDIYAEDSNSASAFSSNDYDVSSRPKTSTKVTWSPPNWINNGDAGPAQKTGDISAVIQEVVNRPGFVDNSPIVIIIDGVGMREAESYNGSVQGAPELCVNFELGAPLPIDLLNLRAEAQEQEIKVSWTTASETNNDFFTVERSKNGNDFEPIGKVDGNGTTTELSNYFYIDQNPDSGINYYRLLQTDFDGKTSSSSIVNATLKGDRFYNIYPSKVNNFITIEKTEKTNEDLVVSIQDLNGRIFQTVEFDSSDQKMEIRLKELPAGNYFLTISNGLSKEIFKFIKL